MVLNLSDVDTKTFTGHSTRAASKTKAEEAGVSTGEILRCGFWSKESTFEKFYHKGINRGSSFSTIYFEELLKEVV